MNDVSQREIGPVIPDFDVAQPRPIYMHPLKDHRLTIEGFGRKSLEPCAKNLSGRVPLVISCSPLVPYIHASTLLFRPACGGLVT
jgi:hypothetical protein